LSQIDPVSFIEEKPLVAKKTVKLEKVPKDQGVIKSSVPKKLSLLKAQF
jgi:hypothetical protein